MFLAFLGAEIAGGAEYAPPPGRVILRPSPGDVLTLQVVHKGSATIEIRNLHALHAREHDSSQNILFSAPSGQNGSR